MRNIKIILAYDGTDYCGWQSQKNGVTIQETLEKALSKILKEKIRIKSAGRTDSGVHAAGQAANFKTKSQMGLPRIKKALNSNLPSDICVCGINEVPLSFDAQKNAKSKIYRYTIYLGEKPFPFDNKFVLWLPYKLDLTAMRSSARILTGIKDFASFTGAKNSTLTTIRKIKSIKILKKGKYLHIDIEGEGFLYNMARVIAGALIEVSRGKISTDLLRKILLVKARQSYIPTAPAKALMLMRVKY